MGIEKKIKQVNRRDLERSAIEGDSPVSLKPN